MIPEYPLWVALESAQRCADGQGRPGWLASAAARRVAWLGHPVDGGVEGMLAELADAGLVAVAGVGPGSQLVWALTLAGRVRAFAATWELAA